MNTLEVVQYYFPWPFEHELSERTKNYIDSLKLQEPVGVFLGVPDGIHSTDVGWAFIFDRVVYISPTKDIKLFEIRLVHELTHIALVEQGYKLIACEDDDDIDYAFANLLHHLVLYPRLVAAGFNMDQDTKYVMDNLDVRLREYQKLCTCFRDAGGEEYTVISVLNDLIRIDTERLEDYLISAKWMIPDVVSRAQGILDLLDNRDAAATVDDYISNKLIIEYHLGLGTFTWL